jgi:hypothetical protein
MLVFSVAIKAYREDVASNFEADPFVEKFE